MTESEWIYGVSKENLAIDFARARYNHAMASYYRLLYNCDNDHEMAMREQFEMLFWDDEIQAIGSLAQKMGLGNYVCKEVFG
jgi:hypothetical protein